MCHSVALYGGTRVLAQLLSSECSTGCKSSKTRLWNMGNLGAVAPYSNHRRINVGSGSRFFILAHVGDRQSAGAGFVPLSVIKFGREKSGPCTWIALGCYYWYHIMRPGLLLITGLADSAQK